MNTNQVINLSYCAGLLALRTLLPLLWLHAVFRVSQRAVEEEELLLTLNVKGVWPEAETNCLFTTRFMFIFTAMVP